MSKPSAKSKSEKAASAARGKSKGVDTRSAKPVEKVLGTAARGRAGGAMKPIEPNPTHRITENERATQANRPIGNGGGVRRGDRRDMHPLFSTGKDKVKGGKRGPIGASTRKGGVND